MSGNAQVPTPQMHGHIQCVVVVTTAPMSLRLCVEFYQLARILWLINVALSGTLATTTCGQVQKVGKRKIIQKK